MAINFLNRPVQEGDPIGSVYQPLTMNQLNKAYEEMSIYGDSYKNTVAPMAVDNASGINNNASGINNIDLTSSPINNILPYIPVTPQGDGRDNDSGITTIGRRDDPENNFGMTQEQINQNRTGILQNLLSLPGKAIEAYLKYGPMGQVKRGYKYLKEKQRVAAENQKLNEEQLIKDLLTKETAYNINLDYDARSDGTPTGPVGPQFGEIGYADPGVDAAENQANNAAARAAIQTAINAEAARTRESFRGNGGGRNQGSFNTGGGKEMMAKGGRIGYGTGGIVTL